MKFNSVRVGELIKAFQDVVFLSPGSSFSTTFLKIMVVLGPLHGLKLWLGVSKGMLPVKYLHPKNDSFLSKSNFMEIVRPSKIEVNLATLTFAGHY